MKNQNFYLWLIIFFTTLSFLMALPRWEVKLDQTVTVPVVDWSFPVKLDLTIGDYDIDFALFGFHFQRDLRFLPGLDLQGGVSATLEADMSEIDPDRLADALASAKEVVERRVNFLGVTEPNIYTSESEDKYRIVVELPGVTDTDQVVSLIGETAQLDFREEFPLEDQAEVPPIEQEPWKRTELTGKYLERAQVVYDPNTGQPLVQLSFDDEGAKFFEEITQRNIDKRLAIFLDERPITAPVVQQTIAGGQATISGEFTLEDARNLVIQLNAGALPVPVSIVQQKNIGPTLGQETVTKSIWAGLAGLGLIAAFMLVNYQLLGVFAVVSLLIYGLLTLAIYKFVPITLTLSGITGFILSFGLTVDTNILIFERIREELRAGRKVRAALNLGFSRAWDSIRDANTATLITVFVLFNPFNWEFLITSGTVRGFALTLGIGVLLSLLTGVVITKTLIYRWYPLEKG